jgi:ryanodine receptor 2
MDFYWHYSGKETVDAHGKENFCRAINVAKQVFNTLTEYIQVCWINKTSEYPI